MKSKSLKIISFFLINLSLAFSLYAINPYAINPQVDDCFSQESLDKTIEIGTDINVDIDINTSFNFDVFPTQPIINKAVIVQIGDQNQAYQSQYGVFDIAVIYQEGISNYAYQEQKGDYNQAYIIQRGSENAAYQYQYTNYNTAIIIQEGYNNLAYQYQGISGGYGYKSIIIQQGNGQKAIIEQY